MSNNIQSDDNKAKTNAEIIDETYFEYHGKYDDGYSVADSFDELIAKGALLV